MVRNNPYAKYKQQSVMTMTPGEMLIALYDGAIKDLNIALDAIDKKDIPRANDALQKTQKIFNYLRSTLDHKYEVSANLETLYTFFMDQLVKANIHKDANIINELIPMVTELKDTFLQADKLSRTTNNQ